MIFLTHCLKINIFQQSKKLFYKNNIPASIQVVYSGQQEDDRAHIFEFYVNDVFADKDNFTGFKTRTINLNILPDDLTTTVELKCTAKETGGSADQIGISVIKAKYPHNFDFNNAKSFKLTIPSSSIRKYIEIENFDGGNTVQLYDLTNKIYLTADKSGSIYKFSLPPSVQDREIIISNVEEIKNIINHKYDIAEHQTLQQFVIFFNIRARFGQM